MVVSYRAAAVVLPQRQRRLPNVTIVVTDSNTGAIITTPKTNET